MITVGWASGPKEPKSARNRDNSPPPPQVYVLVEFRGAHRHAADKCFRSFRTVEAEIQLKVVTYILV